LPAQEEIPSWGQARANKAVTALCSIILNAKMLVLAYPLLSP